MRPSTAPRVLHVVPGPDRHGVTRHALELLECAPLAGHLVHRIVRDGETAAERVMAELSDLPPADLTHVHLTDHLLAPSAGACADLVTRLGRERRISLTLHDLPQPADGPGRYERRRAAYTAMATVAAGVVVSSEHERSLLQDGARELGRDGVGAVAVIPLPLETGAPESEPRPPTGPRRLVIFGYVYPGKGHDLAVEALSSLPDDVGLCALGSLSPGHERLAEDLASRCRRLGREFDLVGYVPEADVVPALRAAAVPVAPHVHVSASGSIGSWLSAGRRPLVPRGRYVDEIEERCPGALFRYGAGTSYPDLAAAARAALAEPELTWIDGVDLGPDREAVAADLDATLTAWAREGAA